MISSIKRLVFATVICIATMLVSISAFASTTDALIEATLLDSSLYQLGTDFDTPYVVPDGNIDPSTGAVRVRELELSLPGKNGLDLNLYREYSSYDPNYRYEYADYDTKRYFRFATGVPYNVVVGGETKIVYVAYTREEDIQDTLTCTQSVFENPAKDDDGVRYYEYKSFGGDGVTLSWNKDEEPIPLYDMHYDYLSKNKIGANISVGHGWYISMPYVGNIARVETSGNSSSDKFILYGEISFEDGTTATLKYISRKYHDNSISDELGSVYVMNDGGRYNAEMSIEPIESEYGFRYNLKITSPDGKYYYFSMGNPVLNASGSIVAIGDKYGNIIRYSAVDGVRTITDTMGRVVSVSPSGITVNAGGATQTISYNTETTVDEVNNPHGYYYTFDTHTMTVIKEDGSGEATGTEKTVYTMKNGTIKQRQKNYKPSRDTVPLLLEIDYPTDSKRVYTYQSEANAPQYFYRLDGGNSYYKGDYFMYYVKSEKLYSEGELISNQEFTYDGTWCKDQYQGSYNANTKKFIINETIDDGTQKTKTYTYDNFARLRSESEVFEDADGNRNSKSVSYSYNTVSRRTDMTDSEISRMRKAQLKNTATFENGVLVSSVDSSYIEKTRQPLKIQNGEMITSYTYDETYFLPLTEKTSTLDGVQEEKRNTLSADKKSIIKSRIYKDGNVVSETSYEYNDDGTIAKTIVENGETDFETSYDYRYNDDCSYVVTTTVKDVTDADGNECDISTEVGYDPLGRQVYVKDGEGNVTIYVYNALGQITRQINPDGTYATAAYNIPDNIITVTDEMGNVTTNAYTPLGQIERTYLDGDEAKTVSALEYDKRGRTTKETIYMDSGVEAVSHTYQYDDLDRVISKTVCDKGTVDDTVTYTYEFGEEPANLIDVPYNWTEYDVSGYQKAEIAFRDVNVPWGSDSANLMIYLDDELYMNKTCNDMLTFTEIIDLSETETLRMRIMYGSCKMYMRLIPNDSNIQLAGGMPRKVTTKYTGDANFVKPTTVTEFDGFGNTLSESYYDMTVSEDNLLNRSIYKHDYMGNVTETLGGRIYMEGLGDYSAKAEYDYAGRVIKQYRPDGKYISYTYDALGNMLTSTDYMGNTTTYTYDALGRCIERVAPFDGDATSRILTYYDKNGNIVKERQQSNKIGEAEEYTETEYAYDRRGLVLWTKTNDGQRDIYAQYAYDKRGNVLKYVYGQTTLIDKLYGELPDSVTYVNYEYDRLGNVIKETDSLGNIKTAEYNYLGLATKETDKNGTVFTKTYDGHGNMTSISNDNNEYWRYSFTPYSQQISAVEGNDFSKSTVYSYDKLGNVSYERMYTGRYANQYTNDVNGNRKTMSVRGNTGGNPYTFTAKYQYDILDRLTSVSFNNGEASVSYTYDDNGKVLTETVNGTVTEYMYNEAGLLTSQSTDGEKSYTMEYGLNGAKTRETADGVAIDYTYDKMGQLIQESRNGVTNQYTYDSRGNRISATIGGNTCNYTYDRANRLIHEDTGVFTNTYAYDKNGNMVCRLTGRYADATVSEEESISVFGNAETSADNINNSEAVYYTYNKLNQLINVTSDDGLNAEYTYSPDGRRLYKTINGETIYTHNDGDNVVVEAKPDGSVTKYYRGASLIASSNGESLSRYSYDPHGSVTMINGVDAYTYDAFGNQLTSANTDNPFRYCGEYFDTETGFIYLRNRYYNPSIGRFISEDPIKDGVNWYVYCHSDPVNFVDPSGKSEKADAQYNVPTVKLITLNTLAYYVACNLGSQVSISEVSRKVNGLRNNDNLATNDRIYSENIISYGFLAADIQYKLGWNEGPGSDSYGVTVLMYSLLEIDSQDSYNEVEKEKLIGDTFEKIFGFELPEIVEFPGFSEGMQYKFKELDAAVSIVESKPNPYVIVKRIDDVNYCLQLGNLDDNGQIVYSIDVFNFNLIRNGE